ncbi:hypothetical protein [Mycobacterium sp. IS-3022]|uniref:hypothetical protein n=1 Tax=Mycobacterium sp. IS-3022 TaxID=1772277 RepID=UPI000A61F347|nr:hypothetical protein [Mycobacterium sp. IS-3022]
MSCATADDVKSPIGLGQLRGHTCGYLERVVTGETIEVIRRGKVVALIQPAAGGARGCPVLGSVDVAVRGVGHRIRLDDLRRRAGQCFDRVAAGEKVEVVWNGRVVAQLVAHKDSRVHSEQATRGKSGHDNSG